MGFTKLFLCFSRLGSSAMTHLSYFHQILWRPCRSYERLSSNDVDLFYVSSKYFHSLHTVRHVCQTFRSPNDPPPPPYPLNTTNARPQIPAAHGFFIYSVPRVCGSGTGKILPQDLSERRPSPAKARGSNRDLIFPPETPRPSRTTKPRRARRKRHRATYKRSKRTHPYEGNICTRRCKFGTASAAATTTKRKGRRRRKHQRCTRAHRRTRQ